MKNIVGISEIVLWTADKEKALQFYRDLLGLEVISPPTLPNVFLKARRWQRWYPANGRPCTQK